MLVGKVFLNCTLPAEIGEEAVGLLSDKRLGTTLLIFKVAALIPFPLALTLGNESFVLLVPPVGAFLIVGPFFL